ncbi:MAG: hypothetical protein AB8B60_18930 [Sulfitobacter sp.]
MHVTTLIANDIQYNPTSGAFEAVVLVRTDTGHYRYPCAHAAALTLPLTTAAFFLTQQAKQRHCARNDLRAHCDAPMAQAA